MIDLMNIDLAGIDLKGIDLASVSVPYLDPVAAYFTYRQTAGGASVGAGKAKITAIYGNSLVWNQLVNPNNTTVSAGNAVATSINGKVEIVVAEGGVSAKQNITFGAGLTAISGHKYLYLISPSANLVPYFGYQNGQGVYWYNKSDSFVEQTSIITAAAADSLLCRLYYGTNLPAGTYTVYLSLIDLTLLFGEGNEPTTVAEFEALYYLNYYGYNAGQIINNKATAIETRDANNALLDTLNLNLTTITGKLLDAQGQPTGSSVVINPEGMAGQDDWADYCIMEGGYITKIVKKTGEADMGTLQWGYDARIPCFYTASISADVKKVSAVTPANLLCAVYKTVTDTNLLSKDMSCSLNVSGYVRVHDSNYSDADTFKTAVTGVKLIYELATPETYLLDNPIKAEYREDPLGTERRLPIDTADSVNAPFKGMVAYPEA